MKKLYRSNTDRVIGGVCGGLSNYFGIDATIIRIIVLLLFFTGGIGFIPYLIAMLIMPKEPRILREEDIRYVPRDDIDKTDW